MDRYYGGNSNFGNTQTIESPGMQIELLEIVVQCALDGILNEFRLD